LKPVYLLMALIQMLGVPTVSAQSERQIKMEFPPDQMPYVLKLEASYTRNGYIRNLLPDIDNDGQHEYAYAFSEQIDKGYYSSAMVCCEAPNTRETLFQYNGPYLSRKIWHTFAKDVVGDEGDDLIMIKTNADTVIAEILTLDSSGALDTIIFKAVVAEDMPPDQSWHDLFVFMIGGIDLNGDGARDLIYSHSTKPDSAFERGITAYDLKNQEALWFFPLADITGDTGTCQIVAGLKDTLIVFATKATMNPYYSNGMFSSESYLLAADLRGHELWRRTLSEDGFYYPMIAVLQNPERGNRCVFAPVKVSGSDSAVYSQLVSFDLITGETVDTSRTFAGRIDDLFLTDSLAENNPRLVISVFEGDRAHIMVLDRKLACLSSVTSNIAAVLAITDLDRNGNKEILAGIGPGLIGLFDLELNLMAYTEDYVIDPRIYLSDDQLYLMFDKSGEGCNFYSLKRQSLPVLFFKRYKWWLSVIIGAIAAFLLYRLTRWIHELYQSSLGLSSLSKVDAAIFVLDRNKRVVFHNRNSLVRKLCGNENKTHRQFDAIELARNPAVAEALEKAYQDPFLPVQIQFSTKSYGQEQRLELVIYPHLDSKKHFVGKIVTVEDISEKINWQRKVVIGEAAQRWIHKLKGSMATARITLDNIKEDQRLTEIIRENQVLCKYLESVHSRIAETGEIAEKVLRFTSIAKPELVKTDLNQIVYPVIQPYSELSSKKTQFLTELDKNIPIIEIDPDQIAEALDNLIANSVEAVGLNGTIKISTGLAEDLHDSIRSRCVEMTVVDDGIGIPEEDLDKVFLPGFTRSRKGTGIGLAIVKEIIENHNGSILVESGQGKGSRFVIRLPIKGSEHENG